MAGNNVLQYVGARYVPVFYNNPNGTWDWLSGVQYEPLTIVKYGTATYTSKKLVPATVGSPNTAPDYWALTGDYNGSIIQIQEDISDTNKRIDRSYRPRVLIIGDSYLSGYDTVPSTETFGVKFIRNIGAAQNVDIFLRSQGGAGFSNGSFLSLLNSFLSTGNQVEEIWVCGGANDTNGANTASGIVAFMNSVPDSVKRVRFFYMGINKIASLLVSKRTWEEVGHENGASFYDLQFINHNYGTMIDNVHPSAQTQTYFAQYMADVYNGGKGTVELVGGSSTIALTSSWTGTINLGWTPNENGVIINVGMDFSAFPQMAANTEVIIGAISGAYWLPRGIWTLVDFLVAASSGSLHRSALMGMTTAGNLILTPYETIPAGTQLRCFNISHCELWRDSNPSI